MKGVSPSKGVCVPKVEPVMTMLSFCDEPSPLTDVIMGALPSWQLLDGPEEPLKTQPLTL
jgi:hypothetical protein